MTMLSTMLLVFMAAASAQTRKSPAGDPPLRVRNGEAVLIGHFNPQQMLRLAIGLEHPHQAEEEQLAREQNTPGSPQFHRFLTADEWNARFAPSAQDEQAVVDWARNQGLTITRRFPNRLIVDAEATVDVIERALQVRINQYQYNGMTYYSNEREPVLPGRVSGLIHSITGLSNMEMMRPASFPRMRQPGPAYLPDAVAGKGVNHHVDGDRKTLEPAMTRLRARSAASDVPGLTGGAYDPADMYNSNLYNYAGLQNLGWCCNPERNGGNTPAPPRSSIAVAALGNLHVDNNNQLTDIIGYLNQYPYLAANITTVPVDGGGNACTVSPTQPCGDDGETTLDTEMATAYANSFGSYLDTAQVWVYEAPNNGSSIEDLYNSILSDGLARTFTFSWDCSENGGCISNSAMDTRNGIFIAMVNQGWTLLNSSGDRGATSDCATTVVNFPASNPYVTGVGGTLLTVFTNGDGSLNSFANEVSWTGGTTAGSCTSNGGGSGGGCSGKYSRPSFQDNANGTCGGQRSVPDVALNSSAGQNYYFNGSLGGVGGTSVASPMMAGFFAQANAYLIHLDDVTGNDCGSTHVPCGSVGWANPYLYYFGKNPNYAPHYPFYDITSGCNSNDITAGNNTLTFYCAGSGYDSVTGWGSANMLQLAWAINTYFAGSFAAPGVNFSGPSANVWYRTPQTLNWTLFAQSNAANNGKANGIAGFSKAWDNGLLPDSSNKATPGSGDSYYTGPASPNATSGSLVLNNTVEGCHTAHVRTWDNGGTTADHTYGPLCYDDIPPTVNCASPDGLWHATDVSLACAAGDGLSGLANSADASFSLVTSVPANTETASAFTNSRTVFDVAGNSTTRGPFGPNKVDKKPPVIAITQPAAANYSHSSTLTLNYSVTDGGSGVGTVTPTMDGNSTVNGIPLTSGSSIFLLTNLAIGNHTFTINAADTVNNKSSASVVFNIIVTPQSIIDDVNYFWSSGDITDPAVYQGLLDKLNQAAAKYSKGQCKTSGNDYQAFINQVLGQAGKGISSAAANILIADAQYLITHCP